MLTELLQELGLRLDEDLPPWALKSISVDPSEFREQLEAKGFAYVDPTRLNQPSQDRVAYTAEKTIDKTVLRAGIGGALSGVAGWAGVPPEVVARVIQSLRLAQRLAIIYGHNPRSDRGVIHIRRALAAAWGIDLPVQARMDMKLSDVPSAVRGGLPQIHKTPTWLMRVLIGQATATVGRKAVRMIPGLGSGIGFMQSRSTVRHQGLCMLAIFQKTWVGSVHPDIDDAVEILG
jgi:hypothetical protein